MSDRKKTDCHLARVHLAGGSVLRFAEERLAYTVWLALPKGVRAAFRGRGDNRPVYPWDYLDRP